MLSVPQLFCRDSVWLLAMADLWFCRRYQELPDLKRIDTAA